MEYLYASTAIGSILRHDGDLLDKSTPALGSFIFNGKPFGSVHNILPADNLWVAFFLFCTYVFSRNQIGFSGRALVSFL
jgi:hypothetical protein